MGCGLWCYIQPNLLLRYAITNPAMIDTAKLHISLRKVLRLVNNFDGFDLCLMAE